MKNEDIDRIVEQLKAENVEAGDAKLMSHDSFMLWALTNPALQAAGLTNSIHQYGPALLDVLRRALGA